MRLPCEKTRHRCPGRRLQRGEQINRNSGGAKASDTGAVRPRIRIARRNDHALNTGGHQQVRTAWPADRPMSARLEAHIGRAAARGLSGGLKSHRFSMGTTARLRPTPAYNAASIVEQNASNIRIWRGAAARAGGLRNGSSEPVRISCQGQGAFALLPATLPSRASDSAS